MIKIKNVYEGAKMAEQIKRGSEYSAGLDLRSVGKILIEPGETVKISTGIAISIPHGYVGLLFVRSSIGIKRGLTLANCVGVIDSDYRGEILGALTNTSDKIQIIEANERVVQLVVVPCLLDNVEIVEKLDETDRGEGGFGSTGRN